MTYYAVIAGRETGIYDDWNKCKAQIHEFKGAKYQKLNAKTFPEAQVEYALLLKPSPEKNLLDSEENQNGTFYAVFVGKKPGIYNNWTDCQNQVHKYPEAKFQKLKATNLFEAQNEYKQLSSARGSINKAINKAKDTLEPQPNFLTVDGASNGENCEYQAVWYPTGEKVFSSKTFKGGTNNIAEFLGLIHGLNYLMSNNMPLKIYTDSVTAMAWVRDGKANTTANATGKITPELQELINNGEKFLEKNATILEKAEILKWETKKWGEIPADYGRKSKKP